VMTMMGSTVNRMMIAALLGGSASCTLVLDRDTAQCEVDAECSHFGGHPVCQGGVCVDLGLGPVDCIAGTPQSQSDYINACSTSKCVPYSNCDRLGLCGTSIQLPSTEDPINAAIPALVNPVPKPTVLCDAGAPNMIYLLGSSDFQPLLRAVQPSLSANMPPYRAVFQSASSCAGVSAIFDPARRVMKDPVVDDNGGWAYYFDENGNQVNCLLDPPGTPNPQGKLIDVGISDLYAQTCNSQFVPGLTVGEYTGPVVPFVLSVPATSSEESISAEALHMVFGLGGRAPSGSGMKDASPWTDPNSYFIRNSGGASTVLTGLIADVPRTKFWGVDRLTTENLRDSLLAATSTNSSIGILSIDYNDKNRDNLKALYLQSKGQICGYQPDSSPTVYDKANVRDGHYLMWGYVHFFTQLVAGGVPSAAAGALVLRFRVPRIEQRLLDEIIAASLTPQCAMKVARTSEIGNFSPQTGFQCGCYFDFKTRGKTTCSECATSEDCPSTHPACNYGFCELR
jgi:hypothetical protein